MSKLTFTTEEKLTLENNVLKETNLQMQVSMLQNDRQGLLRSFCEKNNKRTEDVVNVNIQEGFVEFKEEAEVIN